MSMVQCPVTDCENAFDEENAGTWSPILEKDICDPCAEDDSQHVSTVLAFFPDGEHRKALIGDLTVYSGSIEEIYDSEIPGWLADLFPDGKVKRGYVRTDGWRGYYDTVKEMEGVTKLADGWITGDWGDGTSARKATARDLGEYLTTGDVAPPKPLFWILEPTSNVFSTASELFVNTGDEDAVSEWLADQGFPVEAVAESLG